MACQTRLADLECGDVSPLSKAQIPRPRDAFKCNANLSLIPDLNINNFIRFQRLAEVKPQQRI